MLAKLGDSCAGFCSKKPLPLYLLSNWRLVGNALIGFLLRSETPSNLSEYTDASLGGLSLVLEIRVMQKVFFARKLPQSFAS